MTDAEREHRERMLHHAKKVQQELEAEKKRMLTPRELADAIKELKKKYPNDFPKPL